jgi:hypothetical protein
VETEPPLAALQRHEQLLTLASLEEAIRLLRSEQFDSLTHEHVRAVAEYGSIEIGDEAFFERAFSPGKEAAASLGYALHQGRQAVLADLLRLRATLRG